MSRSRHTASVRSVQTGSVSAIRLFLVCVVALGGCSWDGPAVGVSVVPADAVGSAADVDEPDTAVPGGRLGASAPGGDGGRAGSAEPAASGTAIDDPTDRGQDDGDAATTFPATVAVVGDSLTLSAHDEIADELGRLGLDVLVVDGVESRRMTAGSTSLPSGLDAIETIRAEYVDEPDLWVIALGTNDVGAQVDDDRFRDDLAAVLAAVGPDAPVVWVDLWIRDHRDDVVAANGLIRDVIADRSPPSGVVGWFAHGADDGTITGDGVHLTDRGRQAFATAIANQVWSMYRR